MPTARGATSPPTDLAPGEHPITHAALVEYLAGGAVTELVAAQIAPNTYRLEVSLSWRSGKNVLVAARGGARTFRSLDTLATFLRTIGIGATIVRLALKA